VLTAAAVIAAALYFAVFATVGLGRLLHARRRRQPAQRAWVLGDLPVELAGSVLQVATGEYRPVGGLFYLGIYKIAGFDPLPFRGRLPGDDAGERRNWVRFAKSTSGSVETAFLGHAAVGAPSGFVPIAVQLRHIYEICCFFFYFAALACYVHWRRQGILSWARTAGVLGLAALALNSKEMAVTLPVALLLFELIYHWAERWTRVVIATALLTVVVMAVKLATYNPLSRDPRYHISISASGVIEALCRYFDASDFIEKLSLHR
jgi:hypothetical protein